MESKCVICREVPAPHFCRKCLQTYGYWLNAGFRMDPPGINWPAEEQRVKEEIKKERETMEEARRMIELLQARLEHCKKMQVQDGG